MTAALALPGMIATSSHAEEDEEVDIQYGHYRETERELLDVKSKYRPIESDSLRGSAHLTLTDRVKFMLNFTQDTWSGATPIATAPRDLRGNKSRSPDGVTGASPYLLNSAAMFLDSQTLKFLKTDGSGNPVGGFDNQLVHTMSGASAETRKQVDFKLSHSWDESALDVGGGVSKENDYESVFANLGGRWDINQKQTTLGLGLSYTTSNTKAVLDHDATPYILDSGGAIDGYQSTTSHVEIDPLTGRHTVYGKREDWGTHANITQVLSRNALIDIGLGFVRSNGYMANPYKVVDVGFIDPDQQFLAPTGTNYVNFNSILEKRPDERNQSTLDLRYVQHIESTNAAMHLGYRYYQDDWGIRAHTFDADWTQPLGNGWTITPRVRYYTQEAASFYTPYLITNQAQTPAVVDPVKGKAFVDANATAGPYFFDNPSVAVPDGINPNTGNPVVDANGNTVSQAVADNLIAKTVPFDRKKIPSYYSSDHRLSGFGALSGGLVVSKQFSRGVSLEFGYEYYTHAGRLKMGGGGEPDYADYHYYTLNAAFKIDFGAQERSSTEYAGSDGHSSFGEDDSHQHLQHDASHAPAGVMFDHMLRTPGEYMVGYRYAFSQQAGDMLHGANSVSDAEVKSSGCGGNVCALTPTEMNMHMHMLEIMYAPTDWLNLMVMPQYVDMNMNMRGLLTDPNIDPSDFLALTPEQSAMYYHHIVHEHTTGGVGDTGLYALISLSDSQDAHLQLGLGLSVPTGDVGVRLRDTHTVDAGLTHYGMQLGSGTWDFKPSLTITSQSDRWSWGAQVNATIRLQNRNDSNFAFGDIYQTTAWGSYSFSDWLSTSLRAVYTKQGAIQGEYNDTFYKLGPTDYPANYGGRYWDIGFGVSATVPSGNLKGNRVALEWLQPVKDDVNGYQLQRKGSLFFNWSFAF